MRRLFARTVTRCAIAICASLALAACGSSAITPARIEPALEATFANLLELQITRLQLPALSAPDFAVTAICRKPGAASNAGSGEWSCGLVWQGPNRQMLRDTYDLFVVTDGCYSATVAGESLGGPILKASDGSSVKNLLYAFEGCFDTM